MSSPFFVELFCCKYDMDTVTIYLTNISAVCIVTRMLCRLILEYTYINIVILSTFVVSLHASVNL